MCVCSYVRVCIKALNTSPCGFLSETIESDAFKSFLTLKVTQKIQELLQMKYQFHSRGHFKLSGKPGITTYFLPGRNSSRSFLPQQQQLFSNRNSFRLLNPSSVAKQSESSYEFTSNSSVISSGKECQQPSLESSIHKPPPAFPLKDNAFQVGKVYMTPPSSLGRRRSLLEDPAGNGHKKTANRAPIIGAFHILSTPAGATVVEEDRSPDLPTVHYRNVIGPTGGVGVTNGCSEKNILTQSQILNNPLNGLALHRQISDLSARSQITPSLVNASVSQRRSSVRSSASDSCPGSRKQSLCEIKHQDQAPATNASPSKGSSGSSSQGPPSSRASFSSSRTNNQRGQAVISAANGFENNPVEVRRLSKMEMDDIDEIMKEFTTDNVRKSEAVNDGTVAIFNPANYYQQPNHLLQQQQQPQPQQTQLQQLLQHQNMQQHQSQQQLLAQQHLFQQPANNICGRPASLLGIQSSPSQKMIINLQNGMNGSGLLPEEALQPPVTATVAAQVKCAPRISLTHQMYSSPGLTNWTPEKLAVPQKALLLSSLYTNDSKDGLVRRFSPPPLPPPPGPATHAPMFARAKYPGNIDAHAYAAMLFTPRMLANRCLQLPPPASRPMSLYSAIGGGRPGLASAAQHFRPLGPSSKKIHGSRGGHGPPSSSNQPRRLQGSGHTPLRHARSLENIGSDADDRRSNNSRSGSPSRPDGRTKGQGIYVLPDNVSLSSYSGSEVSRSDPTLGYESGSAIESEYDNYRPGMGSDEDYFVLEPISDIDLDMFDDINVDNVEVSENYNCSYIPMLQKMITDV